MACAGVGLSHDERGSGVSRRVGELASKWIGGQGASWSTLRLNELDPCPRIRYTFGTDAMDTRASCDPTAIRARHLEPSPSGGLPEARMFIGIIIR